MPGIVEDTRRLALVGQAEKDLVGAWVDTAHGCNPRTRTSRCATPPATSIAARSRLSDTQHVQPDSLGATALLRGSQGEQQTAREGSHLVRAAVESGESHSHVTCAGSLPHGAGNNPSIKPDPWILALSQGVGLRRLCISRQVRSSPTTQSQPRTRSISADLGCAGRFPSESQSI